MLTNKILADSLRLPLTRVRRWAKEFLPPDPRATRRSGYTREFFNNDGFFIYLGGILIENRHADTFTNARRILELVKPWMLRVGVVPDIPPTATREGIDSMIASYTRLHFYCKGDRINFFQPDLFAIEANLKISSKKMVDSKGLRYAKIEYEVVRYWIHDQRDQEGIPEVPWYPSNVSPLWYNVFDFGYYFSHFLRSLGPEKEKEWQKKTRSICR